MDSLLLCNVCGTSFTGIKNFEMHVRRCQDKRIMKCSTCQKECLGKVQFDNHMKTHKKGCDICGLVFPANPLPNHKRNIHKESKQLKCDKCPYETKLQANLTRHIITHVPKQKIIFDCVYCKKMFTMKKYLDQHVKTHLKTKKTGRRV